MKSADITEQLKEFFSVTRNDEILPRLDQVLNTPPLGATIVIVNNKMTLSPFGLSNPPTLREISALQQALRGLANSLDEQKTQVIRAEIEAQLGKGVDNEAKT
jgi:hypothetical protein